MSSRVRQAEQNEISRTILAYLADHPDAGDTLEGILQWWLLERKIRNQQAMIADALNELVSEGLILKKQHSRSSRQASFTLNKARRRKIKACLRQGPSSPARKSGLSSGRSKT